MTMNRSDDQVQVSRMMSLPSRAMRLVSLCTPVTSEPVGVAHGFFLLMRNSERVSPQRSLHFLWREFVSPASAPSLLRTIKLRLVPACLEISLQ